ncbi:Uma2 family endonuclease [soil metagenome]
MKIEFNPNRKVFPLPRLMPGVPPFPVKTFSLEEFHKCIDDGMFVNEDKVELIYGFMYQYGAITPRYCTVRRNLRECFYEHAIDPSEFHVSGAGSITIAVNQSEPEPDLMIVRGPGDVYTNRHPYPEDVHIVFEASDETLDFDRTIRLEMYAQAGIPEYWIANIIDDRLEVYTRPEAGEAPRYESVKHYMPYETVEVALPGKQPFNLAVSDILR